MNNDFHFSLLFIFLNLEKKNLEMCNCTEISKVNSKSNYWKN